MGHLRGECWIDAGVGPRAARNESVASVDHAFTGDGEITQSVDIIAGSRIVRLLW